MFKICMMIFIVMLLVSGVSAYRLVCLTYGQSLPDDLNPRYTCHSSLCQLCVTDSYMPGVNPSHCHEMNGCEFIGQANLDITPPNLIVNSPNNNEIFGARTVWFDLEFDEPSSIYYLDNINGRGRWKRLCSKCDNSYGKKISFKDGFNNITIRARNRNGNFIDVIREFRVDSKKPKIKKTNPKKGFANGVFEVQFTEENPENLVLHYGVWGDMRSYNLDLNSCWEYKKKKYCDVDVDVSDFDGREIEYWFELSDIAENFIESKHVWLDVDVTMPVLNYFNFTKNGKKVEFTFNVDEINFDEILYMDSNDRRPKWKRLCSRLKDGVCVKRKTFREGFHVLNFQVLDDAGNAISWSEEIII